MSLFTARELANIGNMKPIKKHSKLTSSHVMFNVIKELPQWFIDLPDHKLITSAQVIELFSFTKHGLGASMASGCFPKPTQKVKYKTTHYNVWSKVVIQEEFERRHLSNDIKAQKQTRS